MKNKLLKSFHSGKNILYLIFGGALIIRFFYFPNDISFGYDQARDAFISLKAITGDIKILGPQASMPGIYHGALIYYILGPLYKIFSGSPFWVAAVFRIVNALGVFLIYSFLKHLFKSKATALLGAFLYAVSFEQSQFSLFLGHPAFGIFSILIFYLGLAKLIFSKEILGLYLAFLGLGLTIQFHFSSISLFAVLIVIFIIFKKDLPRLTLKMIILSLMILLFTLSTYIAAEFKYGFRTIKTLLSFFTLGNSTNTLALGNIIEIPKRVVENNIFGIRWMSFFILILIFSAGFSYAQKEKKIKQIKFLFIIFAFVVLPYIFYTSVQPSLYYSLGASIVLIGISSYVLSIFVKRKKFLGFLILFLLFFSNLFLIGKYNTKGTIPEINAQEGMLLTDACKVMDWIYEKSESRSFSVSAVTIPINVNTTWSYLFEWFGMKKYGYLPIWGGENALGFEGNLEVETAQSKLPDIKFIIIEPPKGLTGVQIDMFLKNEDIFWQVIAEERYGQFTVQQRIRKTLDI